MIIWGWRVISKVLFRGTFFCPGEGDDREYIVKSARKWFTLFFIPVIPLDELGKYVECASCGRQYEEAVFQLPTRASRERAGTAGLRASMAMILSPQGGSSASVSQYDAAVACIRDDFGVTGYDSSDLGSDLTLEASDLERDIQQLGTLVNTEVKERLLRSCVEVVLAGGDASSPRLALAAQVGTTLGMSVPHVKGVLAEAVGGRILDDRTANKLP